MTKDAKDTALVVIAGVLLAGWLGFMGYTIWRDFDAKREGKAFQQRITERIDLGKWEGEV